jgi:hypothetical protein
LFGHLLHVTIISRTKKHLSLILGRQIEVRYKSVRLGVCLLALCGMAPTLDVRPHGQVSTAEGPLFNESEKGEAIDVGFTSDAQRNRSEQAWDWRVAAETSYHGGLPGDLWTGLSARTGKMDWSGSDNNLERGSYVSSSPLNDAAVNRTASILCAEYNLCIDYAPPAPRFGDWQGNIAPLDGSYLTTKQFGWTYGDVLLGNAGSAFAQTAGTGGLIPAMPDASTSNALASSSGLGRPGTVAQSALSSGNGGIVSVATMGAGSDFYQAASSRALAAATSGEDNSDPTGPQYLNGGIVTAPLVRRASSSSSNSTGHDSGEVVDSVLGATGNPGSASDYVWPVVTFGATPDVLAADAWPLEFHTPDPVYLFPTVTGSPIVSIDPLAPVPEPSQIVLMFTVIALVALAAKRSAVKATR